MNPKQLRELIIRPVLEYLHPEIPYSHEAEDLLMLTCAHESNLGEYVKQVGGPALGIYQMEPSTLSDINDNFLGFRDAISNKIWSILPCGDFCTEDEALFFNLGYATAMARVHYYRVSEALPKRCNYAEDKQGYILALAHYAKKYYNTELGKATPLDYFDKYYSLVEGKDV